MTELELAQTQAWLSEAQTALHQLLTGRRAVKLSYEGETVDYTPASIPDLRAWIRTLEARLGLKPTARARARRIVFG